MYKCSRRRQEDNGHLVRTAGWSYHRSRRRAFCKQARMLKERPQGYWGFQLPQQYDVMLRMLIGYMGHSSFESMNSHLPGIMNHGSLRYDILMDTGCFRTLVHKDLVQENKIMKGRAVAIFCAHGDTVLYPFSQISLVVEGQPITVEPIRHFTHGIVTYYQHTRVNWFADGRNVRQAGDALAVGTRSEARRQKKATEKTNKRERFCLCGVKPHEFETSHQEDEVSNANKEHEN